MGIHLRIYKDSPNSTEFQGMNRTPFFDPKKGVPYQRLSPQSGSDGYAEPDTESESRFLLGPDSGKFPRFGIPVLPVQELHFL